MRLPGRAYARRVGVYVVGAGVRPAPRRRSPRAEPRRFRRRCQDLYVKRARGQQHPLQAARSAKDDDKSIRIRARPRHRAWPAGAAPDQGRRWRASRCWKAPDIPSAAGRDRLGLSNREEEALLESLPYQRKLTARSWGCAWSAISSISRPRSTKLLTLS